MGSQDHVRLCEGPRRARGFLSDSYRRLDSRPIIEAFVTWSRIPATLIAGDHWRFTGRNPSESRLQHRM